MLALLLACTTTTSPPAQEADPLPGGWIAEVIDDPAAFSALLDAGPREGWIALHANNLAAATNDSGPPADRARQDLANLYGDLNLLAGEVWERTYTTWEERTGLPPQSAIPVVAALSAYSHGEEARAEAWLDKLDPAAPEPLHALAQGLREAGGLEGAAGDPVFGCGGACPDPLHTEADRKLYNPLVFQGDDAPPPSAPAGLAGVLFGGAWSAAVAAKPVLPDGWRPGAEDDPEAARDRVRAADAALAEWVDWQAERQPEGLALLDELALVDVYRSRALVEVMRQHVRAGQPRSAQAVGLMALDAGAGRIIGATNPPSLFVLLATADLMLGRSREALDMLKPLRGDYPETVGLMETLGDLVVLEGMGSVGDSKEN